MEQARLKEFFRYFRATSQAVSLSYEDIDSQLNYPSNEVLLSTDLVLNALLQLVVQRLKADRAFVSLIDDEFQFVIAEATKTVSLVDASIHDQEDQICIGAKPLSLDAGICAGTMHVFTTDQPTAEPTIHTSNIYADSTRYVINDLTAEQLYESRPYVTGHPHMRWYAEVPLRTPSGYAIGSLAVVDTTTRPGLTDDEYRIMFELASAVMKHLEMLRISAEHSRAVNLLNGLDKFMHQTPASSLLSQHDRPTPPHSKDFGKHEGIQSIWTPSTAPATTTDTAITASADAMAVDSTSSPRRSLRPVRATSPTDPLTSMLNSRRPSLEAQQDPHEKRTAIFTSAASLLKEAADLDGVIFFDAAPAELSLDGSLSSATLQSSSEDLDILTKPQCKLLGAAFRGDRVAQPDDNSDDGLSLSINLVRDLLGLFPKGTIFNFEHVRSSAAPICKSDDRSRNLCPPRLARPRSPEMVDPSRMTELEAELRSRLPASCSIIFHPLWNSQTENWYAACLAWSNDSKSILQSNDLSYITAFSNSIMAEVVNLELQAIDNAKSDFISSISHEVRSPLHGILGSAEVLAEAISDKDQKDLVQIVETCGQNLLETLDNILQYSKINSRARAIKKPATEPSRKGWLARRNTEMLIDVSNFDVGRLVEKSVEGLIIAHQNSTSRNAVLLNQGKITSNGQDEKSGIAASTNIVVMLRVSHRNSWVLKSRSAVWQRILVNLVGNAMKYTSIGCIEIDLSAAPLQGEFGDTLVTLIVRDTGKGISQSYLHNRLYQPFIQEDSLAPGTGLGLSIVKGLVDELHGDISIQSTKGVGTEVRVSIPVAFAASQPPIAPPFQGRSICLLGFDGPQGSETRLIEETPKDLKWVSALHKTLIASCEGWLQMTVDGIFPQSTSQGKTVVLPEHNVHLFKGSPSSPGLRSLQVPDRSALILLCINHTAKEKLTHHEKFPGVFYLSQPFGPLQLLDVMTQVEIFFRSYATGQHVPSNSPLQVSGAAIRNQSQSQPSAKRKAEYISTDKHVLLVEDNAVNLQLLVRSMEKIGRKFFVATDGQQALDMYRSQHTEIEHIFMDVSMPVMDGFTATREIRAFERQQNQSRIPITMVTGLGSDVARKEAETCGCDRFLVKPVKLAILRSLLDGT